MNKNNFFYLSSVIILFIGGCSKAPDEAVVKKNTDAPKVRFTISSDEQEVTDNKTHLIWQRCPEGMKYSNATCIGDPVYVTYKETLNRVKSRNIEGMAWRLPSLNEIESIYNFDYVGEGRRLVITNDSNIFPAPAMEPNFSHWTFVPGNFGNTGAYMFYTFKGQLLSTFSGRGADDLSHSRFVRKGQ